jgi:SAM-dependent methyltransferase
VVGLSSFRAGLRKRFGLQAYSDEIQSRLTARHEYSLALLRNLPGTRILDVGSSFGWLESSLRNDDGRTVTAVEIDPGNLAQARRNVPDGTFLAGSVLSLPFADRSFDAAVMFEVLEHLPRGTEEKALSEVRRVLVPGAPFLLSTPFAHPASMFTDPAWYFGHRHYTRERLRSLFESAGFEIESMAVRGAAWEITSMVLLYAFKWIFRAEVPCKEFMERRRAQEYLHSSSGWSTVFVEARRHDAA